MGELVKYLHIVTMLLAVASAFVYYVILHHISRHNTVREIRDAFKWSQPLAMATPILFAAGILFGLIATYLNAFNFFLAWHMEVYAIFLIALVASAVLMSSWHQRVIQAAAASPDDKPSHELETLIRDQKPAVAVYVMIIAILLMVVVVVLRPFS